MTTAERIRELAYKLNEEADYYGAYIDELLPLRGQTFGEFRKKAVEIDSRYPKINKEVMPILLGFLMRDEFDSLYKPLN